jgi:serine/threonine-protein kinase
MASVFMARDVVDGRLVALKVMHPHFFGDPLYEEMFIDEARLAQRIRHPNVCAVEAWGVDDEHHYMVQELLAGQSFWTVIRDRGRMKRIRSAEWVALATSIVAEMLEGLDAAHEAEDDRGQPLNAVHRDVSPHNVVIQYDGIVKVVDFGIAKATDREKTQIGLLKGKVGYVAPEQILGAEVDRRVDIWAAGVTLWEALTGRFLFRAKGALPTLRAVRDQIVLPPSQANPFVPAALDTVTLWALSRNRDGRPETALEMADALRTAASTALPDAATRAQFMEWEYAAERAHHEQLRDSVLGRQGLAEPTLDASGIRAKTELVSMAEILPIEDSDDVTAVEVLPHLDDDGALDTQILADLSLGPPPTSASATELAVGCTCLALAIGLPIAVAVLAAAF